MLNERREYRYHSEFLLFYLRWSRSRTFTPAPAKKYRLRLRNTAHETGNSSIGYVIPLPERKGTGTPSKTKRFSSYAPMSHIFFSSLVPPDEDNIL